MVMLVHVIMLSSRIHRTMQVVQPQVKVHRMVLRSVLIKKEEVISEVPQAVPSKPVQPIVNKSVVEKTVTPPLVKNKPRVTPKKVVIPKREQTRHIEKKPHSSKRQQEKVQVSSVTQNRATVKERYIHTLRTKIQSNLVYPNRAKRMRIEGVIRVSFTIFSNGAIENIRIINGSSILKQGAIKTLKNIVLDAIPKELQVKQLEITLPISFKLLKG